MVEGTKINTVFFSYDGMTDPLGQSQVLPYLKGLSMLGFSITLISFEKEERKDREGHIRKLTREIGIDWQPIRYTKGLPVVGAMWNVRKLKKLACRLHQQKNFQLIHCRSLLPALVALEMKKKFGIRFLFDMRGFWADERVDGKVWNLDNPIFKRVYNFFKGKEKEALQEADHIVSLTHNGKNIIEDWGFNNAPISVIPCCVDLELFQAKPAANPTTSKELIIGYLGAIGTWYMLPEMMDFFQELLVSYPTATFHFITRENPETILKEASSRGISTKHFKIEGANREDIPVKLQTWDISIFFIKPAFSKKASSPTKQGEIMAMGVPIICNSGVGDTDYVIEKFQAGALVKEFSTTAYQQVIQQLNDTVLLPKENMTQGAKAFYSLKEGINKFNQAYRDALNLS